MSEGDRHRLADRQEISDLLIEYCRALDVMDLSAIAGVFTEDCEVEYGPEDRLRSRGAAGVAKSLERMWRWARTSHHLSNVQIAFDGADRARSVSYVLAWHERPDRSTATVMGQYHDSLVRRNDGWRIATRRMEMNGCDAGFTVNLHRTRRQAPPPSWVAPIIDGPAKRGG